MEENWIFSEKEKYVKDSTFIAIKNQPCSQDEDDGISDSTERLSIKGEELKIMALEEEIDRLKIELIFERVEVERLKNSAQASSSK